MDSLAGDSLVLNFVDCRFRTRIASVSDGQSSFRTAATADAAEANNWAVRHAALQCCTAAVLIIFVSLSDKQLISLTPSRPPASSAHENPNSGVDSTWSQLTMLSRASISLFCRTAGCVYWLRSVSLAYMILLHAQILFVENRFSDKAMRRKPICTTKQPMTSVKQAEPAS